MGEDKVDARTFQKEAKLDRNLRHLLKARKEPEKRIQLAKDN